ncbi:hypothetical protein RF11_03706 [Thelohanellus kitauei]|uniref:Reverse transcriptase/retrotransposon-derived protein RNase H-like domain-containing protein n=1 Tax=Thelohanellus kitauei TaxID=669202 RepID=A0A0C2NBH2_THEKT|nr:hypothetical protein RF11_03706 [Thelohanellus kitauei]
MSERISYSDLFKNDIPFYVDTDASGDVIGSVFSKIDKYGNIKPVHFLSRILSTAKCNYCFVRTDHQPLETILNTKDPTDVKGQLGRRLDHFTEYNSEVRYRKGPEHI